MDENDKCTKCKTSTNHCEECSSENYCTTCETGYYLNEGECIKCSDTMPGCSLCSKGSE